MSEPVTLTAETAPVFPLQGTYSPPVQNTTSGAWTAGQPVGVTANGNGNIGVTAGYNGALLVHVIEQAGGTATLSLQGSLTAFQDSPGGSYPADSTALGYTTLSAGTRSTSVSNISVTANLRASFLIVDPYPFIRAVISSIAGGGKIAVLLYGVPA